MSFGRLKRSVIVLFYCPREIFIHLPPQIFFLLPTVCQALLWNHQWTWQWVFTGRKITEDIMDYLNTNATVFLVVCNWQNNYNFHNESLYLMFRPVFIMVVMSMHWKHSFILYHKVNSGFVFLIEIFRYRSGSDCHLSPAILAHISVIEEVFKSLPFSLH